MVRREATAEASLAAMRERIKFGIAIAAMIRMIATTISNSISEKPFWCFRIFRCSHEPSFEFYNAVHYCHTYLVPCKCVHLLLRHAMGRPAGFGCDSALTGAFYRI